MCPSFLKYAKSGAVPNTYEANAGGYGYNLVYIGSTLYRNGGTEEGYEATTRISELNDPSQTVMFTDAAMPQSNPYPHLIEDSFCWTPFHLNFSPPYAPSQWMTDPTIHFRHLGRANVIWCDGHVSTEEMSFTKPTNIYGADNNSWGIGWFGPRDNSLFDIW